MPNIYLNYHSKISLDVDYSIDSKSNKLNWDNSTREIFPVIRVFDSSYLNGLLSRREIDSTLVK